MESGPDVPFYDTLRAWFDSDDVTAPVNSFIDRITGWELTPNGGYNAPSLGPNTYNGHQSIRLRGRPNNGAFGLRSLLAHGEDLLERTVYLLMDNFSITQGSRQNFMDGNSGGKTQFRRSRSVDVPSREFQMSSGSFTGSGVTMAAGVNLLAGTFGTGSTGTWINVNNGGRTTGGSVGTDPMRHLSLGGLYTGPANTSGANMDFLTVLVYSGVHTPAQEAQVVDHLNTRYGTAF